MAISRPRDSSAPRRRQEEGPRRRRRTRPPVGRAGGPGAERITASMLRLLPEPDSPTMPETASPGAIAEIDAAHGLDHAAIGGRKPTRSPLILSRALTRPGSGFAARIEQVAHGIAPEG